MDTDRRRPWQRNIVATDKARRVLEAIGRPLSDRYTWALGQRIENAATEAGSIAGALLDKQDQAMLPAIQRTMVDHYTSPEAARERDEFIERVARRTRVAKYFRELYGPPEYLFIRRLCGIYERYFREKPAIGRGPFFRFVNAAIEQFGEDTKPVSPATLRKAIERSRR